MNRRSFFSRFASAVAAMPFVDPLLVKASESEQWGETLACAPETLKSFKGNLAYSSFLRPDNATIKSGRWSDPSIWSLGHVPTLDERPLIGHEITLDMHVCLRDGIIVSERATAIPVENGKLAFFSEPCDAVLPKDAPMVALDNTVGAVIC